MDQRFAFSPADLARVKTVQFGILSPDEIVSSPQLDFVCRVSCVKIHWLASEGVLLFICSVAGLFGDGRLFLRKRISFSIGLRPNTVFALSWCLIFSWISFSFKLFFNENISLAIQPRNRTYFFFITSWGL